MDDFVVQVRQLSQYAPVTAVAATDWLLLQRGGVGGSYQSMLATDLVSTALQLGGSLNLAPGNNIAWNGASLSWTAGTFTFSEPVAVPSLSATGAVDAGSLTIAGVAAATQDDINHVVANSVTSFNGRVGDVQLETPDILRAGAAPIWNPNFGGRVTAPTPWDFRQNDTTVATTEWVQLVIGQLLCSGSVVTGFNSRGGAVTLATADVNAAYALADGTLPMAPSPPLYDASNRIATTMFVDTSVSDLKDWVTRQDFVIQQELLANYAPLNSPYLTGYPTAPTAAPGSATGQLATTAFVMNAVAASVAGVVSFNTRTGTVTLLDTDLTEIGGALLAGPAFSGIPTAPTAAIGTASAQLATTAFVIDNISAIDAGVISFNTRSGPVTLTLADVTATGILGNTPLTGVPTAPTAPANTATTQLATTAFVMAQITGANVTAFMGRTGSITLLAADVSAAGGALLASPTFTGIASAPTAGSGTATTQLATTAFVMAALAGASVVSSFNGRAGAVTLSVADVNAAGGPYLPLAGGTMTGPMTPVGLVGVTNGSDAAAGQIGEYLTVETTVGVSMATAAYVSVVSINLSPGDWDVVGRGVILGSAGNIDSALFALATAANSLPDDYVQLSMAGAAVARLMTPLRRVNVSVATTLWLTLRAVFSTGAVTGAGLIRARRVR